MSHRHCIHAEASVRQQGALEFLRGLPPHGETWVVAPSLLALDALSRRYVRARETAAVMGWHRTTFARFALRFAEPALWKAGRVVASRVLLQALVVRVVATQKHLGRFEPLRTAPGFPAALLDTLAELRSAGLSATDSLPGDLAELLAAYEHVLDAEKIADPAMVFVAARENLPATLGPLLLHDVCVASEVEAQLARAALERAASSWVSIPKGAWRTARALAMGTAECPPGRAPSPEAPLAGFADGLFEERSSPQVPEAALEFLSAPGEAREALEIARKALSFAGQGVPFDRMAVVLREPARYAAHLEEAFGRAAIPVHCRRGTRRPSPAGRAFVALLRTAREGLSARRFAEYLSFGQVPDDDEGLPPAARGRFVPIDDDFARPGASAEDDDDNPEAEPAARPVEETAAVTGGGLRAPMAWERMLVQAAVLGTMDRWTRRVRGLLAQLEAEVAEAERDGLEITELRRKQAQLIGLERFALPLLAILESLPASAGWSTWLPALRTLAERGLRQPEPVLRALLELEPLAVLDDSAGQVDLDDVLLVLEPRITTHGDTAKSAPEGAVLFASPDELAGLDFDVVFVAGLAEKVFPARIAEDPLLLDAARAPFEHVLCTNHERANEERFRLILAVGAATRCVVLSYPRLDVQASRPRTPSFYLLELWRAKYGNLPRADELSRRAAESLDARLGWPAPKDAAHAVDDIEYDLGLLERLLRAPETESGGLARYLLTENPHLGRALRARAERWNRKKWYPSDGLVIDDPAGREALAPHQLAARSFSPTALQNYAACPYRFYLQAILRLAPREEKTPAYELNPLERGSLVHQIQFEFLLDVRKRGWLPLAEGRLREAHDLLDEIAGRVVAAKEDELAPAIPRVWQDQITDIRADMHEWLRRMAADAEFQPAFFELAFGLVGRGEERDPRSQDEPVALDCGIQLRGSIDLVEVNAAGAYRATDYKTGKIRAKQDEDVIKGGAILQPVFYALTLEQVLAKDGKSAVVDGGRLAYCTFQGGFANIDMKLDDVARGAAATVGRAVGSALEHGFLPAVPAEGECKYCDFKQVCGPYEEIRTHAKPGGRPEKKLAHAPAAKEPVAKRVLYELGALRRHK